MQNFLISIMPELAVGSLRFRRADAQTLILRVLAGRPATGIKCVPPTEFTACGWYKLVPGDYDNDGGICQVRSFSRGNDCVAYRCTPTLRKHVRGKWLR